MLIDKSFVFLVLLAKSVLSIPPNDKALFDDDNPEARIRKRRPCRPRSAEGRTFFDWSLQYIDLNYNYNYNYNTNINCGESPHGGGGGGGNYPPYGSGGGGGGVKPQKPLLSGLAQGLGGALSDGVPHEGGGLFGLNGPIFGPINFAQSQVQSILVNRPFQGLFQSQPQDSSSSSSSSSGPGLFNGQGVLSLFENGLFSGIFDSRPSNQNVPNRPAPVPPRPPSRPTTTPKPDTQDPDDIIYNDERPVHEDHDAVFPDQYNRPGQYLVATNPIFGQHVYDVTGYKNQIVRQYNREINRLAKSFADLFGL